MNTEETTPPEAPQAQIAPTQQFAVALEWLRVGAKVAREGWNGKDMWIVLQKGYPDGVAINKNTAEATGIPEGTTIKFLPYLMMKTADGCFVPWVASQTDILAHDWQRVDAAAEPTP